jgi:predicted amidohydrolase
VQPNQTAPIVAVAQTTPMLGDVDRNLAAAASRVSALAGRADLIVFPELFTTGYQRELLDHQGLAEPLRDSPTLAHLGAAAAQAEVAIIGTILELDGGVVYDTAVVIDRSGQVAGRYRKTHLYPAERRHFGQGDEFVVVDLGEDLRVGLAICFEHAFPEIFTELALAGANIIAIPSAVPEGFGYLLDLRTRARAQDNQVFVAASNFVGFDGHTRWCGGSSIVNPRGEALASAGPDAEAVIAATLDLVAVEVEREQEPVLRHRRPELYQRLHGG